MSNKWPIFTGNNTQVNAVKIGAIRQQDNGYGVITPEGGYPAVTVTDSFMRDWKPVVGGYLVQDATGQLVFMSAAAFEAQYTPGGGDVTSADITDATSVGRQVLTAANAAAARTAIGAGTSSLALGTTASTALAGNGTAAAATKLATARTITLTGAVTGSATFDGTGNISIATTAGA